MTQTSYRQLAQQYMELWQKQMSAVLTDREFIQSMLEMMQAASSGGSRAHDAGRRPSAHAADSPGAANERLEQLDYRLRMLEQRIGALEESARKTKTRRRSKPAG
ncbi:MAG: hypothetical protein JO089_03840 [Alphaproteobacteria bacterium]|nr:hypothetical protein [Alphaproteobacteria bacterium]